MVGGRKGLGIDEIIGQFCIAKFVAPHLHRIIDHFFFAARAVFLQHFAGIGIGKDRLDARADIAGIKANGAGGRDRGQKRVANAIFANRIAHVAVHFFHRARGQKRLGLKQRKCALFFGKLHRGKISSARNLMQPVFGLCDRRIRSIAQTNHQQGIGQTCHTQPDTALGAGLLGLRFERKVRGINHIIHHPNRRADQILQRRLIQLCGIIKGIVYQTRQIDRAQKTGAIGRQRLLTAGVRCRNCFAIAQVIGAVDPVNKDHTRFGIIIGRLHDFIPKPSGGHRLIGFAIKHQIMLTIGFHCLHKGIRDKHGDIKHPQPRRIRFGSDKVFYIGMITAHCGHHRTAPRSGAHDGAAHRIPDIHK